jgi:metacaspase-1
MKKKALLIGINNYKNPRNNLRGCVSDVNNIQDMLDFFGYESEIIVNKEATKDIILNKLKQLVEDSKENDKIVFYFSGHGSQIIKEAKELDEVDTVCEILCPYDIDFKNNIFIEDVDIMNIFSNIHLNVQVDIVLDCCYSGSAARDYVNNTVFNYIKAKSISSGSSLVRNSIPFYNRFLDKMNQKISTKENINYIVWSACQENQKSNEVFIEGVGIRGIFTFYFCNEIIRNTQITRNQLDNNLTVTLTQLIKDQIPLLQYYNTNQLIQYVLE